MSPLYPRHASVSCEKPAGPLVLLLLLSLDALLQVAFQVAKVDYFLEWQKTRWLGVWQSSGSVFLKLGRLYIIIGPNSATWERARWRNAL